MKIGIISDTHSCWDDRFETYFADCDEVWHAGDIGSTEVADRFEAMRPTFRAVHGNIDDDKLRARYPEVLRLKVGSIEVLMTHIGGYPGRYDRSIAAQLRANPPRLFISGHSHILKVMPDKRLNLLHINPGAAGKTGWHKDRTLVRLTVEDNQFTDCEVITLGKR
ncbi:phosphodiesterase family protein [Hallella bergensis DSM 17361]|uniref:Phosphoesterase n=1 Tax=Hallella bergensis DSM 17361 TaxID=585502 RepID=D1PUK7_9BACT|nr:metallophosphoesterase family protein [Hallella bergensis]EFA44846.1 phosphodiesterase family protein [Hallella bergensis DSM 17361]